ncbi:ABC transporter substrate-binding protein [Streptomyces hirsutus]
MLKNGSALGEGHQTWMLNEVNKLVWPSENGIGAMDKAAWDQTIDIAVEAGVLKAPPTDGAYRTDLTERALKELKAEGFDITGESYKPETVTVTPGGK